MKSLLRTSEVQMENINNSVTSSSRGHSTQLAMASDPVPREEWEMFFDYLLEHCLDHPTAILEIQRILDDRPEAFRRLSGRPEERALVRLLGLL
jgi:hypothetical protein